MAFNMALSWKCPQNVPTFHFSLYFFHLLFSKKHLVVSVFSCFVLFLCWLGGCGSYFFIRGVPDISHTPRIISSLVGIPQNGIQHGSFREVAPKCPNLSCFPLFFHLLFSKKHLVVSVFSCLFCFWAGWVVVAAKFLFEGFRTSHIPLEFFLT